jgi:hypothetical protein
VASKNKIGTYDMSNPTSAIDSYGTLIDQRGVYNLVPREDIILVKKHSITLEINTTGLFWLPGKT